MTKGDFEDENMNNNNNPYDVLGISRTSSSEKARKVFLEKCKRLHPDKRKVHGREEEEDKSEVAIMERKNETKSRMDNGLVVGEKKHD